MALRAYIDRRVGKPDTDGGKTLGDVVSIHLSENPLPAADGDPTSSSVRNAHNTLLIIEDWPDIPLETYMRNQGIDKLAYPYEVYEQIGDQQITRLRSQRRVVRNNIGNASVRTNFRNLVRIDPMAAPVAGNLFIQSPLPQPVIGGTIKRREDERRGN